MMIKRLVCLLLGIVMLSACFVGCSQETDEEAMQDVSEEASDNAVTLSMYLLSEEEVSPEQAQKIETAVNKITKPKFKTQLKLHFYTEDKYYAALDASFDARIAAEEAGMIIDRTPEEGEKVEDETFVNEEWGITEIKYPTIDSFQVDIFYMGGYDNFLKYRDYKEVGMLTKLDEELAHSSKLLTDYISSQYLTYMDDLNNGTFALPTNTAIGKYQYLLLNKEVLAKTRYNTETGMSQFTSFTCDAVQSVLSQVSTEYKDDGYAPIYSCLGPDGLPLTKWKFWGVDEDGVLCNDFSLLACPYPNAEYLEKEASFLAGTMNIFQNSSFKSAVKTLKMYKHNGYYTGTEQSLNEGKVAVAYLEGSPDIVAKYSDNYEVVAIGTPIIETEDLYKDMFAITPYSSDFGRSMEILTFLNTDAEFRNLLLYGIEGENYEMVNSDYLDENGQPYKVVRRTPNNTYVMSPNKTGNTLLAYTLEGGDPTLNEYIKLQNKEAKVSVTMGFLLDTETAQVDDEWLENTRVLSLEMLKRIREATYEEILDETGFWKKYAAEINANTSFSAMASLREEDATVVGIYQQYRAWAIANKIYDPEAAE
jgi:hypothetical protein